MEITYACESCDLNVRFKSSDAKAPGNASWENCQCPKCGAVLGDIRDDWGTPQVVYTEPRTEKTP
jgi:hypothetical protein